MTLVRERAQANPFYHTVDLDPDGVAKLPEDGVPPQLMECACPLLGSDSYRATHVGPGSIRDPMEQACDAEEASDEETPEEEHGTEEGSCAGQPEQEDLNQRETPLGLDPTATPSYVQHLAAFQAKVRGGGGSMPSQPAARREEGRCRAIRDQRRDGQRAR